MSPNPGLPAGKCLPPGPPPSQVIGIPSVVVPGSPSAVHPDPPDLCQVCLLEAEASCSPLETDLSLSIVFLNWHFFLLVGDVYLCNIYSFALYQAYCLSNVSVTETNTSKHDSQAVWANPGLFRTNLCKKPDQFSIKCAKMNIG